MKFYIKLLTVLFISHITIAGSSLYANQCEYKINVGSFNIESSKSDIKVITKQIAENHDIKIWGIVESSNKASREILKSLKKIGDFKVISGTNNQMDVFYDSSRFEPLYQTELHYINYKNRVRSPLVVKFLDLESKAEFYFMVNHLYRSNAAYRHKQAYLLNQWAKDVAGKENIPVIALGDYNFDMYYRDISKRDKGYENLINDEVFHWIKPNDLFPTQCSKHKSILDFVFISSNNPSNFHSSSEILHRYDKYCSYRNYYSDHRPVIANIDYLHNCELKTNYQVN